MANGEVGPEFDELSGGKITLAQQAEAAREQIKLWLKLSLQIIAFLAAIAFVAVLTYFFIQFIGRLMCLFETGKAQSVDWHVMLLGSGFIVPATLILYSLVRWTHTEPAASKNDDEELPSSGLLKEVTGMLKDVADMVSSLAKKSGAD